MPNAIKIIVIDDHPLIIQGLKQLFSDTDEIKVTASSNDGVGILTLLKKNPVDVVILDIGLKDRNGVEVLREIKEKLPELPVLIFSMYSNDLLIKRCFEYGASGFVTKDNAFEEVVEAIHKVVDGETYVSPQLVNRVVQILKKPSELIKDELLSDRERETLHLLGKGKTIAEIAEELEINAKTVSTYRNRIIEKLNLRTTGDIVRYAVENKIV